MPELDWSGNVVGIPRPDGIEIWDTQSGKRLKMPALSGPSLPPIETLSKSTIDHLREVGMISYADVRPHPSDSLADEGVLGLPSASLARAMRVSPPIDALVVGVALDAGVASNPGARHGPEVLRRFSSRLLCSRDSCGRIIDVFHPVTGPSPLNGKTVVDIGDLFRMPIDPRQPRDKAYSSIYTTVQSIVSSGVRPLVLGGDHSVTAPAFLAVSEFRDTTLVVFDAHLDAEDAGIERFDELTHVNFLSQIISLRRQTEIYVLGVREHVGPNLWPPPEKIHCLPVAEGLAVLQDLPPSDVYLSVDVDVLDPSIFPATGHPVPGGATTSQLAGAIRAIGSRHRIVAADIMETMHSPAHDYISGQVGGLIAMKLLEAIATDGADYES